MKSAHPAFAHIQASILTIRNQKVMLDRDLAMLYGVETKRLNEQVKRNSSRFPIEFIFQLTREEKDEVVANCDHLQSLKFAKTNPYAFTEHGAIMLASILNSDVAISTSIAIVKAFIAMRKLAMEHESLGRRIDALEKKYDSTFASVFAALRKLIEVPSPVRRPIGFVPHKPMK